MDTRSGVEEARPGSPAGSSAAAKSTGGYSNPSESNAAAGCEKLNEWLRSIVMSRTAYSLFHGFNPNQAERVYWIRDLVETNGDEIAADKESSSDEDAQRTGLPNFTSVPEDEHYDKLLSASFSSSSDETKITTDMGELLQKVINKKHAGKGVTLVEAVIPNSQKPRLDVAFGDKKNRILNAFVEVGLTRGDTSEKAEPEKLDQHFWKKINQAIDYLELLPTYGVVGKDTDGKEYAMKVDKTKTLLLCVIVTNRERTWGRIAVFACEPKAKSQTEWRIALMWRREAGVDVLSRAFGYYISAINFLIENDFVVSVEDEEWKYMGPNCSKVTVSRSGKQRPYVLRSYDNRVRQTTRSPVVYHKWKKIKDDTKVMVRWFEKECDPGTVIEFGDAKFSEKSTIFRSDKKCGKVEVIAVPFISGNHICSTIGQALDLIRFLKEMHGAGFVHGDIRGLNAVFSDKGSALIDHDFGGREGKARYPKRYNRALVDGTREIGKEEFVLKRLDILALKSVFQLHYPPEESAHSAWFSCTMAKSLEQMEQALAKIDPKLKVVAGDAYDLFMKRIAPHERDDQEKQTQDGETITPDKPKRLVTVTLPSKRSAPTV